MMLENLTEMLQPRILMITPFARIQRGNSLTSARLCKYLSERGFKIDLVAMDDDNWDSQFRNQLAFSHYNIIHAFNAFYFVQVLEAIPDLVWLNLILTTTGTDLNIDLDGPDGTAVLDVLLRVQKIVVFNQTFQAGISARYPQLTSKLITIPQGIDLPTDTERSRQDIGLNRDNIVFVLPSGLRPVKNIELAINALTDLHSHHPLMRLLLIGPSIEADYSRRILSLIKPLDWVIQLGEVPHEEISGWLALGDVVLNTSDSEGQPQAVLEAMSMGIPSILTAVPGNLGIIEPGEQGFYVHNQSELTEVATKLAINPELRRQMGSKARLLTSTRFTLEQEIEAYSRLYRHMTGI